MVGGVVGGWLGGGWRGLGGVTCSHSLYMVLFSSNSGWGTSHSLSPGAHFNRAAVSLGNARSGGRRLSEASAASAAATTASPWSGSSAHVE